MRGLATRIGGLAAGAVIALGLLPGSAAAAPGDLDPTFGSGGFADLEPSTGRFDVTSRFAATGVQEGGGIVIAGTEWRAECDRAICNFSSLGRVARFDQRGALDPAFGSGGVVEPELGAIPPVIADSVLDGSDRILLAGPHDGQLYVVRLTRDGRLDDSFGTGGIALIPLPGRKLHPDSTEVQVAVRGGRIVVAAMTSEQRPPDETPAESLTVALLDEGGAQDSSFGEGGLAISDSALGRGLYSLVIDSENRIVTGEDYHEATIPRGAVVRRLTPSGEPDPAFGRNGFIIPSQATSSYGPVSVATEPDDDVVAMTTTGGGEIFRLRAADGAPDPTFGNDGRVEVNVPGARYGSDRVAVSSDGAILAAGARRTVHGGVRMTVARMQPNGARDAGFGRGGVATTFHDRAIGAPSLAFQPDGRLLWVSGTEGAELARFEMARDGIDDLDADGSPDGRDRCVSRFGETRGCPRFERSLRGVRLRNGAITGKLSEGHAGCAPSGARVLVMRRQPGRDPVLKRARVKRPEAGFRIRISLARGDAVYLKVERRLRQKVGICGAARSRTIRR